MSEPTPPAGVDPAGVATDPGADALVDTPPGLVEDHRGAFGEFGGESGAFIDRSFRERIVLVGVSFPPHHPDAVDESLDELQRLVDTAGADEVARVVQRRSSPDPATYIGKGKASEVKDLAIATDCDTVVFDDELAPNQQFNLEKLLGRTAIDRTAVILDIFAQNASSQEGKAQVELAQLRYRLPRLRGKGRNLSQQAGGIGTRGPGETQLEVDRRRIVRRIHKLEADLVDIARHRATQRKSRSRANLRHVVIVGYTNAGKSTLLNALTDAGVVAEDRLFATLDSSTRRLAIPGGETVLCTDTVGFVRKLPHQLVEAFRSTLDVTTEADLLVHVVDGSAADPQGQIDAVHQVLAEIGGLAAPELLVINKADLDPGAANRLVERHPGSVAISAATGAGVDELLQVVAERLRSVVEPVDLLIPWERGDLLAALHRTGEVVSEVAGEGGMAVRARIGTSELDRFAECLVHER